MTTEQSCSFEEWMKDRFQLVHDNKYVGGIETQNVTLMRESWQASRASLLAEIQSPEYVESVREDIRIAMTEPNLRHSKRQANAAQLAISVIVKKLKGEK